MIFFDWNRFLVQGVHNYHKCQLPEKLLLLDQNRLKILWIRSSQIRRLTLRRGDVPRLKRFALKSVQFEKFSSRKNLITFLLKNKKHLTFPPYTSLEEILCKDLTVFVLLQNSFCVLLNIFENRANEFILNFLRHFILGICVSLSNSLSLQ